MEKTEWIKTGRVTRLHGMKGEIFVSLFAPEKELARLIESHKIALSHVYPDDNKPDSKKTDDKKPKLDQVLKARPHKNGLIIQLKGMDKPALDMKGAFLYVPKKLFRSLKGDRIYLCEVLDFEVEDQKQGQLGEVTGFSDNGGQDLLKVQNKDILLEIPFIREFVLNIDFQARKIYMDLPEGLTEGGFLL